MTLGGRIAVMRDGRIEQVAPPLDLYARPINMFVARFIGAPAMNLVPATLRHAGGEPAIALPFMDLDAARWSRALLDWPAGSELLLGIRPQDLVPADGEPRAPSFEAGVHLTEPLGDVTVLDLEAGGAILKMVLPEERAVAYAAGDRLRVSLAPADAYLFSKESGVLIAPMPGDHRPAE